MIIKNTDLQKVHKKFSKFCPKILTNRPVCGKIVNCIIIAIYALKTKRIFDNLQKIHNLPTGRGKMTKSVPMRKCERGANYIEWSDKSDGQCERA